jgi:hypothetical protein
MILYEMDHVMIRTAVASDIPRIALDMRLSDRIEVYRSHGHSPGEALLYSFNASPISYTVVFKGKPVAMFGLQPAVGGQASIWLLGGTGLSQMWFSFLRLSRLIIGSFLENYPVLFNFVDASNASTIRWLKWCGAKFGQPETYGIKGCRFRGFVIERGQPCATP